MTVQADASVAFALMEQILHNVNNNIWSFKNELDQVHICERPTCHFWGIFLCFISTSSKITKFHVLKYDNFIAMLFIVFFT